MRIFHPHFPFNPGKFSFFYGWVMVALCSIGMIASIPGQTIGVSVFTDHLIEHFKLSRLELSTAYMLGTIMASFFVTTSGKFYDRHGGRISLVLTSFLFGLSLIQLSHLDHLNHLFFHPWPRLEEKSIFVFTLIGFMSIRFLGQGTLMVLTRSILMHWFDKRRGLVNGISGIFISISFSSAPLILNSGIEKFGWRNTWILSGVCLVLPLPLFFWLLVRNKPEEHGLLPDGKIFSKQSSKETKNTRDYLLKEARRTLEFWAYTLSLALLALYITAYAFHLYSIYKSADVDPQLGLWLFLPSSILAILTNFVGGYLFDKYSLKIGLYTFLVSMGVAMIGVLRLGSIEAPLLIVLGNGIAGGHFPILSTIVWPKYFGRKHLGAINGLMTSVLMFASALGPFLFAHSKSFFTHYAMSLYLCLGFVLLLLMLSAFVKNPREMTPPH